MAQTPEGRVKEKVSRLLKEAEGMYYWMPVPSGFGDATLDYVGCYLGRYFAIETKAPGKKPTLRQQQTIAAMGRAGGKVFVIDGNTEELEQWIRDHHSPLDAT
jgi:hypothetical protein